MYKVVYFSAEKHVQSRHVLLKGAIGTFPEEDDGIEMLEKLSWILPITILMGSLVDTVLVVIYMKFVHPWRDILSSELISERIKGPSIRLTGITFK